MATFWEIASRSVGHMFSLSLFFLYFLFIPHFGFKSGIWLLIAPVPVHCFSITFATFVRKLRGWRTLTSVVQTLCMSCSILVAALQQHCVLQKLHKNRKEDEHVENHFFDIVAALRPCIFVRQSCGVANNTLKLLHETQILVIADRCRKADVKQA